MLPGRDVFIMVTIYLRDIYILNYNIGILYVIAMGESKAGAGGGATMPAIVADAGSLAGCRDRGSHCAMCANRNWHLP